MLSLLAARSRVVSVKALPSLTRSIAGGGSSTGIDEYEYVYLPPGCSLKEPSYSSASDPIFYTDPTPAQQETFASLAPKAEQFAKAKVPVNAPGGPHGYRMVDDYSQQTYVYSASRTSMREPRYVSITDPVYMQGSK